MKKGNIEKANGLNLILKDNVNQIDRACAISHKEDHEMLLCQDLVQIKMRSFAC